MSTQSGFDASRNILLKLRANLEEKFKSLSFKDKNVLDIAQPALLAAELSRLRAADQNVEKWTESVDSSIEDAKEQLENRAVSIPVLDELSQQIDVETTQGLQIREQIQSNFPIEQINANERAITRIKNNAQRIRNEFDSIKESIVQMYNKASDLIVRTWGFTDPANIDALANRHGFSAELSGLRNDITQGLERIKTDLASVDQTKLDSVHKDMTEISILANSIYSRLNERLDTVIPNIQTSLGLKIGRSKENDGLDLDLDDDDDLNRFPLKVTDPPIVKIFDLIPAPIVLKGSTYANIQRQVNRAFAIFKWPALRVAQSSGCGKSGLNNATKICYHYFNPVQNNVTGMITWHSPGAGKTGTARIIASIHSRAGFDVILAAPEKLRENSNKAAVDSQADFNVQQYTRGKPLKDVVIRDLVRVSGKKQAEVFALLRSAKLDVKQMEKGSKPGGSGFQSSNGDDNAEGERLYGNNRKKNQNFEFDWGEQEDQEEEDWGKSKPKPKPKSKSKNWEEDQEDFGDWGKPKPKGQKGQKGQKGSKDQEDQDQDFDWGNAKPKTRTSDFDSEFYGGGGPGGPGGPSPPGEPATEGSGRSVGDRNFEANLQTYLYHKLTEMGVRQYPSLDQQLTFKQLSNLASNASLQVVRNFLMRNYPEQRSKDLFYKTFFGIDEGHHIVASSGNVNTNEIPEFKIFRELLWTSMRLQLKDPTYECARVLITTGSIVVKHPLDAINLVSLLYLPDPALGFNGYYDIKTPEARDKTEKRFMDTEFDYRTLRFKREDAIREFFKGRVSYFNFNGEPNIFPQVVRFENGKRVTNAGGKSPIEYVPVKLSYLQAGAIAQCLAKDSKLLKSVDNPNTGRIIERRTGGLMTYDMKQKQLKVVKLAGLPQMGGSTDASKKDEGIEGVYKCISTNSIFPWLRQDNVGNLVSKKDLMNMSAEEAKKFMLRGDLKKYSPLIDNLIENVIKKTRESADNLRAYYSSLEGDLPDYVLKNYKQFIYVNSSDDQLGTRLVGKFLEAVGYTILNEGGEIVREAKTGYKGVIILDNKVSAAQAETLLKFYNAKENADGRNASILIVNDKFKEGINALDVAVAHILGVIIANGDLDQIIGRVIRNCARKNTPFRPGAGWTLNVLMYSPAFTSSRGEPPLQPLEMIEALRPDLFIIEHAKEEMLRLIRESAFDKNLLETINNESDAVKDELKLYASRK